MRSIGISVSGAWGMEDIAPGHRSERYGSVVFRVRCWQVDLCRNRIISNKLWLGWSSVRLLWLISGLWRDGHVMLEQRKQAGLDREWIVRKRRCCSRSSGAPGSCAIFWWKWDSWDPELFIRKGYDERRPFKVGFDLSRLMGWCMRWKGVSPSAGPVYST